MIKMKEVNIDEMMGILYQYNNRQWEVSKFVNGDNTQSTDGLIIREVSRIYIGPLQYLIDHHGWTIHEYWLDEDNDKKERHNVSIIKGSASLGQFMMAGRLKDCKLKGLHLKVCGHICMHCGTDLIQVL